ncbi:hypothetical protein BSKO_14101 [Bryopsis sp. KO-2023]|nr:hypothetical protein BSKO_14101 [Bryopsis sp. KO-2023]
MVKTRSGLGLALVQLILALSVSFLDAAGKESAGLNYRSHGADWPGLCQSGEKQSPVGVTTKDLKPYAKPEYAPNLETLGVAGDITFLLTTVLPHVEVEWERLTEPARATLAATKDGDIFAPLRGDVDADELKRVAFEPAQFHFHTPSENSLDGNLFDGIIHVVNFVKDGESEMCDSIKASGGLGCPVVVSIFLKEDERVEACPLSLLSSVNVAATGEPNPSDYLIRSAGKENGVKFFGHFDLDSILPSDGKIAIWEGSLTTAPCTEGVFWIQFLTPADVSFPEIMQLRNTLAYAAGSDCKSIKNGQCFPQRFPSNNRMTQPLNGRVVRTADVYSEAKKATSL